MKKVEIHPLSASVGAAAALLLLFACSSSGKTSVPPVSAPAPNVTSQVTFYADTSVAVAGGPWNGNTSAFAYTLGTTSAATVITDVSWTATTYSNRLLVNGVPVYAWGFGGAQTGGGANGLYGFATPSRFSLAQGIRVPAGAVLTIETDNASSRAYSLAGYTL